MSRTAFYCRCGARLEGASARLYHRCPPVAASGDLPDEQAERDPEILDLETVCAWCGREHSSTALYADLRRVCDCRRHIDRGGGKYDCNAALPTPTPPADPGAVR